MILVRRQVEKRYIYRCVRRSCGATHGAHANGRPHGWPADAATRWARHHAHQVFDQLWLRATLPDHLTRGSSRRARRAHARWLRSARRRAMAWLAAQLGLVEQLAHIGAMTQSQALNVIAICEDAVPDEVQAWARPARREDAATDRKQRHKKRLARGVLGADELSAGEGPYA
jgi:hypothetical protein